MAAVQKNEGESMIPKWKKSKLVGGRKYFCTSKRAVLTKEKNRKVQITINGADRDFTSLC